MSRVNTRMARRKRQYDRTTMLLLGVFVLFAAATVVLGAVWINSLSRSNKSNGLAGTQTAISARQQQPTEDYSALPVPDGPLQNDTGPTPVPWDDKNRITVLFMGMDARADEEDDVPRTDTMILFSLDPGSGTAGMLSIPRDLWVNIPEVGYSKINTAYRWGEVYDYPGGGPGLAMKTVEDFLGVPVNYYAQIDFMAFVRFVDELGGLKMNIREEIVVDPIGPGNTKTLEPGVQTLDGATVLAYARMRYTEGGDFDRAARQQEVILALRDQILSLNQLPTLILKAPRIYQQLSAGLHTNLTLQQVIQLTRMAAQVEERQIKRGIISPPLQVEITMTGDGQSVLMPDFEQIAILRDEVFSTSPVPALAATEAATPEVLQEETPLPTLTPTATGSIFDLMQSENARVMVQNGTVTTGLASHTSEMLRSKGIQVTGEGNADTLLEETTIYDYTGKPYTVQYLLEILDIPESRVFRRSDPGGNVDIEIILGADWAASQ